MNLRDQLKVAIGEAGDTATREFERRITAAHLKILDIHKTLYEDSTGCHGCGMSAWEDENIPDVNDCPVLLALAEAYLIPTE